MDWSKFNELTILIIDDDQLTRELIRAMLKEVRTITVHVAIDGLEALKMIKHQNYDMLLVDLYMPKMNGEEFVSILKKDNYFKFLPIVLITTDRLSKKELKKIGTSYYLSKPFDFQNFLKNIHTFFEEEILLNET